MSLFRELSSFPGSSCRWRGRSTKEVQAWGAKNCWSCIRDCKACGQRGTMSDLPFITLEETKEHFWGALWASSAVAAVVAVTAVAAVAAVTAVEAREGCARMESSEVEHKPTCLPMSSVLSTPHLSVPFPGVLATVCTQLQWAVIRHASQLLLGKTLIFF